MGNSFVLPHHAVHPVLCWGCGGGEMCRVPSCPVASTHNTPSTMRAATQIRCPLRLILLAVLTWQAAAEDTHRIPDKSLPPSYEELSSSLVVNQLAILQLMQSYSKASCAAAEMGSGRDGGRDKTGGREESVLWMMEGLQQQVLGVLNATTTDMLARIEGLREEMREELTTAVQDMHIPASQSTQQPAEDKTAAVPGLEYPRILSHNDTLRSLCNGNKILHSTVGSLELVDGGAYSNYLQCSWELNFPQESSVNLSWDYIDIEADATCDYDWVQVLDTRDSQLVYGRKLCGRLNSTTIKLLNVKVHGTRRLLVSFQSDRSTQGRGFRMTYQAYSRPWILSHNDTLRSLCNGNKILNGTVGTLEVVNGGAYSNYLQCSWELNFPQESSVNLSWDYIDIEADATCGYDWVQVLDTRDSQLVYGRKLCGRLNPPSLKLLHVTVHGTRRLLVSFRSDDNNQGRGFRMTYQAHSRPS